MRLRRHYLLNAAIVAINQRVGPAILADGTFCLDESGPMDGTPRQMDVIIGASDAGSFDRYVSKLMRYPCTDVGHLKHAVRVGDMPARLGDISFNILPAAVSTRRFRRTRTLRNWIALVGFRSRFFTWFGYESWFGRVVLRWPLYPGREVREGSRRPPDSAEPIGAMVQLVIGDI